MYVCVCVCVCVWREREWRVNQGMCSVDFGVNLLLCSNQLAMKRISSRSPSARTFPTIPLPFFSTPVHFIPAFPTYHTQWEK